MDLPEPSPSAAPEFVDAATAKGWLGTLRGRYAALGAERDADRAGGQAAKGDTAMRAQAAVLCQRARTDSCLRMFHYHRAHRRVPERDSRNRHRDYGLAERLEVAE